jgi:DNA invertase Pin-like site-specific DNA recombinase
MLIGYARVSTEDQNPDMQVDDLKKAGCIEIFVDKISGANKEKPELAKALNYLRQDDALVVWKLDRLGRSVKNLIERTGELEGKGIHFKSLTDSIDTSTPAGRFFFHMMASLSEMERDLLIERTQKGLAAARKRGRIGGRKRLMTPAKVDSAKKLLAVGSPPKEVAANLGISVPTLYRWLPASEREIAQEIMS